MNSLTSGMRWILRVASILVLIAGFQLFVLTDHTDRYFAWTIRPFLTAAFLGASYWASFVLVFQASREPYWAYARAGVFSALTFTTLTTVATALHLDKFHFAGPEPITLVANWAWMIVYCFVPPILLILLIHQLRQTVGDPPRTLPLPIWIRSILFFQALAMLGFGITFFIFPERAPSLWPWMLTPLTARVVGAWLLGMAVAAGGALKENDLARARGPIVCYAVLGFLQAIALARYANFRSPGNRLPILHWDAAAAWIYLAFVLSVLFLGVGSSLYALFVFRQQRVTD